MGVAMFVNSHIMSIDIVGGDHQLNLCNLKEDLTHVLIQ